MRGKRIVALLALTILISSALRSPSFCAPPITCSDLEPQTEFAPPSSRVGNGYPMNLTDSVNDFRTVNLEANNTRADTRYRNETFSGEQLAGFTKIWQNLTLTQLEATYDAREIQGGDASTEYLRARNQTGVNHRLAMRFTTSDKVNLTGVWMYYSLGGLSGIPFSIGQLAGNTSTPNGASIIGGGTVSATAGADDWFFIQLNSPVTLTRNNYYWLIIDASGLNGAFFDWYYLRDSGSVNDGKFGSAYRTALGWLNETQMISAGWVPDYFNLMTVLKVIPVDDSFNIRKYSSPQQVNMYLNTTGNPIAANSTRISNVFNTFVLCTNTSVTFTARWDARFEKSQTGIATTHFIAEDGKTFWNVTFGSGDMPANIHTLHNRTLKVSTVPSYWAIQPSNVSNMGAVSSFTATYTPASGFVFIIQGGNPDTDPWVDAWLVKAKSTYKITASLAAQVVAGLPLILSISTGTYSGSWCNVTFYNAVDYPAYSRNVTIPSNSYLLQLKLNVSGIYTLFLFDRLTGSNEASLNRTLTVNVLEPLCSVTVDSIDSPILGNPATAQFMFLNGTAGGTAMQPITVLVNGTNAGPIPLGGGVYSVSWNTISGGWRAGSNRANITAFNGVYHNFTLASFTILPPNAKLTLNATSYSATYGDNIPIGFSFLNLTGGGTPFPSAPTLYRNGSSVGPITDLGGGSYAYVLSTRSFAQAGAYHLNFTAKYGTYVATNITAAIVNKLGMIISLHLDQTSVTAGSSLSASATLMYPNGTNVEDLTDVVFWFNVTYTNGTWGISNVLEHTENGIASSAFLTTSEMKWITVSANYSGDGVREATGEKAPNIPVTLPSTGFPIFVVAGVAGAAVVMALVPIAARARRRKGREEEHRKTAVLRQTASLAQLVVVDLRSGRCVFSKSLGSEENVDPHLISGFLSANQSVLEEVFKGKSKAGLRFADYGDYKVISHVGNYIMATLFATESAGEELKGVLEKFTDRFEKTYGKSLESWDGDTRAFKDAEEITDEVFALQLTAPYMLLDVPNAKLNKNDRAAAHFARILSSERGVFFMPRLVDYLLTKQGLKRGQAMDAINSLTKKGIFRQLTIEQAAQVVKSTLEKSGSQT